MIQLRILTKNKEEGLKFQGIPNIITQIENILGYKMEITDEIDSSFEGFYLLSFKDYLTNKELFTKERAKKIFLLGVFNSEIPEILDKYCAIGLVQFQLLSNTSKTIHCQNSVIEKYNLEKNIEHGKNYSTTVFFEFDGQDNALAQSIIKYLTMCNNL
jgi:hypothetical protein